MMAQQFDKREYDKRFLREHYKWVNLGFNQNVPEEKELYDFVKSQPAQAPFIKGLIREAMNRTKQAE